MLARKPADAGATKATVSSACILPPRMRKIHVCRAATIIDGKQTAADIRKEIAAELTQLKESSGKAPGLAVVLVGERKDSQTYVRSKKRACEEVGIVSFGTELAADVSEDEVLEVVRAYNANEEVHGILVQLPLPSHMNETTILDAVDISKDVDGFHPLNIGCLAMRGRQPRYVSCTPKGCMELLKRNNIDLSVRGPRLDMTSMSAACACACLTCECHPGVNHAMSVQAALTTWAVYHQGKRACVVGRSNIVGLPMALLLQNADATVTMVHSRTPDAQRICSEADIVVAACGRTEMVTGDWIKPGAAVIDVGINSVDDPSKKKGYRLVGDVDFAAASENAAFITPVPGGVGPMTIAMLLSNCVEGFKAQEGLNSD